MELHINPIIKLPERDHDPTMCKLCFHTLETLNNLIFDLGTETYGLVFLNQLLMYFRYFGIKLDQSLKDHSKSLHFVLDDKPICEYSATELHKTFTQKLTNNPSYKAFFDSEKAFERLKREGL